MQSPQTLDLAALQASRYERAAASLSTLERELERRNDWLGRSQMPWDSLIYKQHFDQAAQLWHLIDMARWFEKQNLIERLRVSLRPDFKLDGRSHFWVVKELSLGWQRGTYDGLLLPGEAAFFMWMGYLAASGATGNEIASKEGW